MNEIRVSSETGEYHIILNFIRELNVFSNDIERTRFRAIIGRYRAKLGFDVFAYAIMKNHVHMLVRVDSMETLVSSMIGINTRFAKFYNRIYERRGRVFSRRYTSVPVSDETYFFTCFRYILRNPVRAGVVKFPWDYKWSSAVESIGGEIENRFKAHYSDSLFSFREFIGDDREDHCVLDINRKMYYDAAARKLYNHELNMAAMSNLNLYSEPAASSRILNRLRRIGVTYKQLSAFSGHTIAKLRQVENHLAMKSY